MNENIASAPERKSAILECRYLISPEEFAEAIECRRVFLNTAVGKLLLRSLGIAAVVELYVVFSRRGVFDIELLVFLIWTLAGFWLACGLPGRAAINRCFAHLSSERSIAVFADGFKAGRGRGRWTRTWPQLKFFQITANLIILQGKGPRFWAVPKRVLPAASFGELLSP